MYALDPRQRHGCGCDGEAPPPWVDAIPGVPGVPGVAGGFGGPRGLGAPGGSEGPGGQAVNCSCSGLQLLSIPPSLSERPIRSLLVQSAGMQILRSSDLNCCRRDLQELTLEDLKNLTLVENGILQDMSQLRSLAMYRLTSLIDIPKEVFEVHLPRLRILRIIHTGIRRIPPLNTLGDQILEMVDLEGNNVSRLASLSVAVRTSVLLLGYNLIESVEARAFESSQIAQLSLKGNANLRFLHPEAFQGIDSLRRLDLSRTAITELPTRGLENLEHLLLQDTHLLKVFPAAFHFKALQAANLTYPYHCCAFSHPAAHRPEEYASYQEKLREVQARCSELNSSHALVSAHRRPRTTGWEDLLRHDADETFHQDNVTLLPGVLEAVCGDLARPRPPVSCSPEPDAFSPCEDLMGNWLLRLAVWAVSVAALLGNGAVLVVLLSPRRRLSVPRFLMCHLAAADLAMGAYLLMLAVMDAVSVGSYFNYAIDWQNGAGCQVAGFLTVFASELSVFTLTLLTAERWYTITYAIHMNRRLRLSTAMRIMAAGWAYALLMALLPLVDVSGYYVTSICLPLRSVLPRDRAYLGALLSFTAVAFLLICACYLRMYRAVRGGQDARAAMQRSDVTRCAVQVAKRMTLLVLTDFACWAPIAFFGTTALLGAPLIDVPRTKILLVFFYPLNACANPYLYALLTRQFRNDLLNLLSRSKLFASGAARYVPEGNMTACGTDYLTKDWLSRGYILGYSYFCYFLPLKVIIYCYWYIVSAVSAHEKSMREQAKKMNVASLRSADAQQKSAEGKLAKIALMTISLWFMAWTPYLIVNYIGVFDGHSVITPLNSIWASLFAKANSCYNPIVYGISHPKYRVALYKKFPCLACSAEPDGGGGGGGGDSSSVASGVTAVSSEDH